MLLGRIMLIVAVVLFAGIPQVFAAGQAAVAETHSEDDGHDHSHDGPLRLAITYDGGIMVFDAEASKVVSDIRLDGFLRLNGAGDEKHVIVSVNPKPAPAGAAPAVKPAGAESALFRVLYLGQSDDDAPRLYSYALPANKPGHVTVGKGATALFNDGSGVVMILETEKIGESTPKFWTYTAPDPHHGVLVPIAKDAEEFIVTVGTASARSGARAMKKSGAIIAESKNCPGVHGESEAAGGVFALGCENGVIVYKNGAFTKISSPDAYGRMGIHAPDENSRYVLADYKTEKGVFPERTQRVSVIDTEDMTIRIVNLGNTSYSFRSLGRGPEGEGVVLGTDGRLHFIDMQDARVAQRLPVVGQWSEPSEWREPRPTLRIVGDFAFVTEPDKKMLHVVDLYDRSVLQSVSLPHTPNEIASSAHGH